MCFCLRWWWYGSGCQIWEYGSLDVFFLSFSLIAFIFSLSHSQSLPFYQYHFSEVLTDRAPDKGDTVSFVEGINPSNRKPCAQNVEVVRYATDPNQRRPINNPSKHSGGGHPREAKHSSYEDDVQASHKDAVQESLKEFEQLVRSTGKVSTFPSSRRYGIVQMADGKEYLFLRDEIRNTDEAPLIIKRGSIIEFDLESHPEIPLSFVARKPSCLDTQDLVRGSFVAGEFVDMEEDSSHEVSVIYIHTRTHIYIYIYI